ncbi:MAG: TIGR03915 family putative DNA repair protein [Bacteroidetes bacterium]|nr:TIGR03915 family putative DNA repair protein [Bacteroidota bacterium]
MNTFVYDGTFEGLLCAIFESYTRKCIPDSVVASNNYSAGLWDTVLTIDTNREQADRVWKSLQNKLAPRNKQLPFHAFLYGTEGIDQAIFNFIRLAFDTPHSIDYDYANADVLKVKQAQKVVTKEAMRTIQFVRFQKTADDIFFAALSPDFDVIPLVTLHFMDRFKDQQWVIYDLKREYGVYYNLKDVKEITMDNPQFSRLTGEIDSNIMEEEEASYQNLWQNYVKAVTIRERLNLKLQLQHMPRRYWKYLTEKQGKKG